MKEFFHFDADNPQQVYWDWGVVTNGKFRLQHIPQVASLKIENFDTGEMFSESLRSPQQGEFFCNYSEENDYRDATGQIFFNDADNGTLINCEYLAVGSFITADDLNEVQEVVSKAVLFEGSGNTFPKNPNVNSIFVKGDKPYYFLGQWNVDSDLNVVDNSRWLPLGGTDNPITYAGAGNSLPANPELNSVFVWNGTPFLWCKLPDDISENKWAQMLPGSGSYRWLPLFGLMAFELLEDLELSMPDNAVTYAGAGSEAPTEPVKNSIFFQDNRAYFFDGETWRPFCNDSPEINFLPFDTSRGAYMTYPGSPYFYHTLPAKLNEALTGAFTIEVKFATIYPNPGEGSSYTYWRYLLAGQEWYCIGIKDSCIFFQYQTWAVGYADSFVSTAVVDDGQIHRASLVRDAEGNVFCYLDRTLLLSTKQAVTAIQSTKSAFATVGGKKSLYSVVDYPSRFDLYEIRVWKRALAQNQTFMETIPDDFPGLLMRILPNQDNSLTGAATSSVSSLLPAFTPADDSDPDTSDNSAYMDFSGTASNYAIIPAEVLKNAGTFTIEVKFSTTDNPDYFETKNNLHNLKTIIGRFLSNKAQKGDNYFTLGIHNKRTVFTAITEPLSTALFATTTWPGCMEILPDINDGNIHTLALTSINSKDCWIVLDRKLFWYSPKVYLSIPDVTLGIAHNLYSDQSHMNLKLYELRLWNTVRSREQIFAPITGSEDGLRAWIKPTENGLVDFSSNNFSITLNGNPQFVSS